MTDSCAEQSLTQAEALVGTATGPITHWICVELPGAWPARFKAHTLDLPPALSGLADIARRPQHKLVLIRGRRPTSQEAIRVFVAQPNINEIRSWSVSLTEPHIDWNQRLSDGSGALVTHPLILVCTHGSRDRCCGVLGGATFAALHKIQPEWVWQVSHLGGHRFAPTLLSLPSGELYGRITAELAKPFMAAMEKGDSYDLAYLRGNTRYAPALQAVLAELGQAEAGLVSMDQEDQRTRLELKHAGTLITAVAERIPTGRFACASCVDTEPRPIMTWRVSLES